MMCYFTNGTWRRTVPLEEIPISLGNTCLACGQAVQPDDCGVSRIHMDGSDDAYRPWHLACFREPLGIEGVKA